MTDERSENGTRVYGRTADTAGAEVKVQAAFDSPAGPRTWLITGGPSIRFDLPNTKRLITALETFVTESEGSDAAAEIELPQPAAERFRLLIERSAAVADEWREYAGTLSDGPSKARALGVAAAIYVERVMSALPSGAGDEERKADRPPARQLAPAAGAGKPAAVPIADHHD